MVIGVSKLLVRQKETLNNKIQPIRTLSNEYSVHWIAVKLLIFRLYDYGKKYNYSNVVIGIFPLKLDSYFPIPIPESNQYRRQ